MTELVKPTAAKLATKWALINLAVSVVLTYTFEFLDIDPNSPVKYVTYIPFVAFLFLTQKEFRDQLGGFMTFGQGFSAGLRYSVFTGLLMAVFTILYLVVLSPGMWEKILDHARNDMESKGTMSEAQIDMAMNITSKYGIYIGAFVAAIGYTIMGIIISLIGAAIFKKERSAYDFDDEVKEDPAV